MTLAVAVLVGVPLFAFARRGELDGNPERFVGLVVAALVVESLLYPAQADVPVGPFRVPFLGGSLRTHDALVVVGVLGRATVRPIPQRISRSGILWLLAFVWLLTATAVGLLAGHRTNVVLFSAMSLVGLFGTRLLVAGCDATRLIALLRGRWIFPLAAVVILLIPNTTGEQQRFFDTDLGVLHPDTASVFVALGTFVLLIEWSAPNRRPWAAWAALALIVSPFAMEQQATLLHLGATALVIAWAMSRPEWRSNIRLPRIRLLWGLLAVVFVLMIVLIVQLSRGAGSSPFADYYESTFASEGQRLSAQARTEALEVGLEQWADAPVYGHGLGHTYEIVRPGDVGIRHPGTFDNVPLDLLVRSGVVGLVLFGGAFVSTVVDGIRVWRRDRRSMVATLALAATAVMIGLGAKSLVESILEKGKLALVIGLSAGVIAATVRSSSVPARANNTRSGRQRWKRTMDLTEMSRALRRFWLPALAVLVLTVAISYAVASRGGTRYESTASIAVTPNPAVAGSANIVDYHIPVIVEKVGTRSFRAEIREALGDEALDATDELVAENDAGTGIVRIRARGPDRDAVALVANAAAGEVVGQYAPSAPSTQEPDAPNAVVVEVIDEAATGTEAEQNDLVPIMLAGLVLGAILAVGTAVLAQRSISNLDLATRVRNEVGIPVLAVLPILPELKADNPDLAQLISSGPAPLVEAFQGLRTRIEVQLGDGASTLAVTSWRPGEGRTTITAGLGLTLAAIGRDVVVIDTDLRDPKLHDRLGEPCAAGLAELEQVGRQQIVSPTAHPRLSLVAAGVAKEHPSQILAVALPPTLEEIAARASPAVTLLDAPPLHPARHADDWVQLPAETVTVVRAAQRVLLVIDAGTSHVPELARAVERLREDDVIIVGAVLNRRGRGLVWRR